jgi:hypothetical protein
MSLILRVHQDKEKTHEQLDDASDGKHKNTMKLWDRVLT